MASGMNPELAQAIIASSKRLGIDPVDLATTISYESEGTFSPSIWGGKNRNYLGLIQFGPEERAKYGVTPSQSAVAQMGAVENFLRDRGVRPGMGLLDVYSTINAGAPGLYNRSDAANGGMPGTVRDKVEHQMGDHRAAAMRLLGMSGAGMLPTSSSLPASNATHSASSATPTAPNDTGDASFMASLQAIPKLIAQQQPTVAPAPPVADNSGMRAKFLAAAIAAASKQQEGPIV
jgi:hypothetical protein